MFEGSATTMLSSLDTVASLSDDTLLWPGRFLCDLDAAVLVVWMCCCGCMSVLYGHAAEVEVTNKAVCPLAVLQVTSMQRTTSCLRPKSSRTTRPEKTNASGCCSSAARGCARWASCTAVVLPLCHVVPERTLSPGKKGLSPASSACVRLSVWSRATVHCRVLWLSGI